MTQISLLVDVKLTQTGWKCLEKLLVVRIFTAIGWNEVNVISQSYLGRCLLENDFTFWIIFHAEESRRDCFKIGRIDIIGCHQSEVVIRFGFPNYVKLFLFTVGVTLNELRIASNGLHLASK